MATKGRWQSYAASPPAQSRLKSGVSVSLQMKKIARRQQQQQQQQQEQDQLGNPRLGSGRGTGRNSRQSNDDSEGEELGGTPTALGAAGWGGGIGSNRSEREHTRGVAESRQVVAELVRKLSVTTKVE